MRNKAKLREANNSGRKYANKLAEKEKEKAKSWTWSEGSKGGEQDTGHARSRIRDIESQSQMARFDAKLHRLYRDLSRHGSAATVAVKYHQLRQVFQHPSGLLGIVAGVAASRSDTGVSGFRVCQPLFRSKPRECASPAVRPILSSPRDYGSIGNFQNRVDHVMYPQ